MNNEKGTSRKKNKTRDEVHEVEELLLAAEDDLLLKLNLNSHLAHSSSSSSPLDDDLSRRFEALKSSKSARVLPSQEQQQEKTSAAPKLSSDLTIITKMPLPETQQQKSKEEEELERVLGADLSARFAALRGDSSSQTSTEFQVRSKSGDKDDDEVEKVIQWAIDAARLDPSSPTDEDDAEDEDNYDGDSGEDDDDDVEHEKREPTRKRQQK